MNLTPGNLLILVALGTSIATTANYVFGVLRGSDTRLGETLSQATAAILVLAITYLGYQFYVTDYTNNYVWGHTADFIPLLYRLTGIYAGVKGSLLLWTTFVALGVAVFLRKKGEYEGVEIIGALATGIVSVFILRLLLDSPFAPLEITARSGFVFGPAGMNPLLLNPYMAIHPPITFGGYAATVVPFAIAIGYFTSKLRDGPNLFDRWLGPATRWLRISWVLLAAANGLGALWSYRTFGWGGIWAWDPVETSLLIAWLFVTLTLHVVANYRRGEFKLLAPTLAALTFPAVLFARLATLSGQILGSPKVVHTFGNDLPWSLIGLLVLAVLAAVLLPIIVWLFEPRSETESTEAETPILGGDESIPDQIGNSLSSVNLLHLSVIALGLLTFVSFWGLIFPAIFAVFSGTEVAVGVNFFNMWSFPLAIGATLLIGLYNDYEMEKEGTLRLLGLVVIITFVAALIPLEGWQIQPNAEGAYYSLVGNVSLLSMFPPAGYAMGTTVYRLIARIRSIDDRRSHYQQTARALVHIGFVLVLLGAPFTYAMATTSTGVAYTSMNQPTQLQGSNYAISISSYSSAPTEATTQFTPAERELINEKLTRIATPADQVSESGDGSVIVYGSLTDVTAVPNSSQMQARFEGSDLWVQLFRGHTGAEGLEGKPVVVQGQVSRNSDRLTLQTSWQFQGLSDPTDAIRPEYRAVKKSVLVSVYQDEKHTVTRRAGIREPLVAYNKVPDVIVKPGLLADTYVTVDQIAEQGGQAGARIQVKHIPLMNLVRLGLLLVVIGGVLYVWLEPPTKESTDD